MRNESSQAITEPQALLTSSSLAFPNLSASALLSEKTGDPLSVSLWPTLVRSPVSKAARTSAFPRVGVSIFKRSEKTERRFITLLLTIQSIVSQSMSMESKERGWNSPESSLEHATFTTTTRDVEVSGTNDYRLRVPKSSESFLSKAWIGGERNRLIGDISQ